MYVGAVECGVERVMMPCTKFTFENCDDGTAVVPENTSGRVVPVRDQARFAVLVIVSVCPSVDNTAASFVDNVAAAAVIITRPDLPDTAAIRSSSSE